MGVFDYKFNLVFGNLYNDGSHSIGWHSDEDSKMGIDPAIASVSFGAVRKFSFMEKFETLKKEFVIIKSRDFAPLSIIPQLEQMLKAAKEREL